MTKDNALQYVGPIMDAYDAAEKAGASALHYAFECGKQLSAAFKTVTAAKGKWKQWRDKNLPRVSEETERVYRRLADAVGKQADVFAECKSIRDAIKHLSTLDENLNPKPTRPKKPRAKRTGSTATALEPPEPDTTSGLEAELENAAADEIISNIHDADKFEEVAKASFVKLSPEKISDTLTKAWDADQLHELIRRVSGFLAVQPADQAFPSEFRQRPLTTPAQPSQG
jgi:hypothetical protein